jgi:hypothetical protein
MNAATDALGDSGARAMSVPHGLLRILRSATWPEVGFFFLISLVIAAINATSYFEWVMKGEDPLRLLTSIVLPLLVGPFIIAAWLLADRPEGSTLPRRVRMVLAVAGTSAFAAVVLPPLVDFCGLHFNGPFKYADGKSVSIPDWIMQLCFGLDVAFFSAMSFAVLEMSRRRRQTERAVDAERLEQTGLARQLLESRLAAMQAQVEPQFLFDALVDIERLYARDAGAAAGNLDRLIQYLRVALPRLRESGSSIQAEVELVESYLAVVQALHDERPQLRLRIERDCAMRTFYPMLLLPLVQRAVRRTATVPATIEIEAALNGHGVAVVLRIASTALCQEDGELERVRERLKGLYGGRARLDCVEPSAGVTEFTLQLPAA